MKSILSLVAAVAVVLSVASCASVPKATVGPFPELEQKVLDFNNQGTLAALGIGEEPSHRYALAFERAKLAGRAELAAAYESKVSGLVKQFGESLSGTTSSGTEVNDAFSQALKNVFSKTLNGSRQLAPVQQLDTKDTLKVAVVMGIDAKLLNASLLDEVKVVDQKLYERFRASQAYEELKKETEGLGK